MIRCEDMRVRVSDVWIETAEGDIADFEADAVVNAANSELWMGSGVAGALRRKGGIEIEAEAVAKGPIRVGEAVATRAGSLRAKWVIHAAAMGPDLVTDESKIRRATMSALKLAHELNAESMAIPSLGTGVGGFPMQKAAEIMIRVVLEHARKSDVPRRVVFVLFSGEAKGVFDRVLEQAARTPGANK